MDELLNEAGMDRSGVYVTNSVKFRPVKLKPKSVSNRTPTTAELKAGLPLLRAELSLLLPRVIVTLGNTPLKAVLTLAAEPIKTVGELHGQCVELTLDGRKTLLCPEYHPASVIYNRSLASTLSEDMQRLGRLVEELERS